MSSERSREKAFRKLLYREIREKTEISEEAKKSLQEYYEERYKDLPELVGLPPKSTVLMKLIALGRYS